MLCVGAIIIGGYIHGDMHFAKVLEHLKKWHNAHLLEKLEMYGLGKRRPKL
jgi:hypothetical protein